MKKLITAIASSLLIAVGLVGFSGSAAHAKDCPYTGCFETNTELRGEQTYHPGDRPEVQVRVTANGNVVPKGKVVFRVAKEDGTYWKHKNVPYRGGWKSATLKRLDGPGQYTITAVFKAGPNRPYRSSMDSMTIRVVP